MMSPPGWVLRQIESSTNYAFTGDVLKTKQPELFVIPEIYAPFS